MTPDSEADPDRPESAPVSPSLSPNDHLAIDAAVAGVAGLLLGRVLFGRAGGLVAGIAAVGAGLLAKRTPPAKKTDAAEAPASAAAADEAMPNVLPVTHVRLETGGVPAANDLAALDVAEPPVVSLAGGEEEVEEAEESGLVEVPVAALTDSISVEGALPATTPAAADFGAEIPLPEADPPESAPPTLDDPARILAEDAGAFAEMPALFTAPEAERAAALPPEPDISQAKWPGAALEAPGTTGALFVEQSAVFAMPKVETAAVPPTDAAEDDGKFSFDEHPLRPDVEILPVAELAERADKDLASEARPSEKTVPPPLKTAPVPATEPSVLGLLDAFPPEYVPLPEEPQAGPREEFLMIPDHTPDFPPPIQPVVAALSASLESTAATPAAAAPAPMTVMDEPKAALPEVPDNKPVDPPPEAGLPLPDPEEIWRQAAVELAALRSAPVPVPPPAAPAAPWAPLPISLPAIPFVSAPAPPPFPSLAATTGTAPAPAPGAITPVADKPDKPAEPPPWLKEVLKEPPLPEVSPETDHGDDKAFLPTIRLAVPQNPPSLSARRPVPLSPGGREAAPPSPAPPAPLAAPVPLPGYRAEPLLPPLPTPAAVPSLDSTAPLLPPVPLAPVPASAAVPAVAQETLIAPPAFGAASQPAVAAGDAKVFVPRRISSRRPDPRQYKKRLITPFRVVLLAIFAAGALGMVFKPQLIELWEQRILGKPAHRSKKGPSAAPGAGSSSRVQGDATDVKIAPEPTPVPAPAPKAPVADPAKEGTPPPSPPAGESSPPVIPLPPDIQAIPESPPPAAEPETSGPLPVNETGARELVSRLLRATSPDGVKPYILESARLAPGLGEYFSSGRAVPVASWEINLDRADKVAGKRTLWQFRVVTDNVPRGFPVGVEETPDGLRADWELFAQCRDSALRAFLDNPAAAPGRFFVSLKRAHTFPDMLPGQDHTAFFAFDIASPAVGDSPTTVFIRKGTPLATRADGLFKWETAYAPVLEIAHKNGSVEITAIVRENWRAVARQGSR